MMTITVTKPLTMIKIYAIIILTITMLKMTMTINAMTSAKNDEAGNYYDGNDDVNEDEDQNMYIDNITFHYILYLQYKM